MTQQQLITLLKSFMEGTTSLDEEAQLDEFFAHATDNDRPKEIAPDDWQAYREMFQTFAREATATEKHHARTISMRWMAAAASIAAVLVAGAWLLFHAPSDEPQLAEAPSTTISETLQATATTTANDSSHIDAERLRMTPIDSTQVTIKPKRKPIRRLRSMPPAPKAYLAESEKADDATTTEQPLDLYEAIKQADRLLQAMQTQQMIEIKKVQLQYLQAMDMLDGSDEEIIEQ